MIDWLRYGVARAIALPTPAFYNSARYPRTLRGLVRHLREQWAPSEIAWYETEQRPPSLWWAFAAVLICIAGVATDRLWLAIVGAVILTAVVTGWIHHRRAPGSQVGDDPNWSGR